MVMVPVLTERAIMRLAAVLPIGRAIAVAANVLPVIGGRIALPARPIMAKFVPVMVPAVIKSMVMAAVPVTAIGIALKIAVSVKTVLPVWTVVPNVQVGPIISVTDMVFVVGGPPMPVPALVTVIVITAFGCVMVLVTVQCVKTIMI